MILKNIFRSMLIVLPLSVATVACEDTNDAEYEGPGAEVASDCPQVYFSDDNQTDFNLTTDSEFAIDVTLNRKITDKAIDVPLNIATESTCFNVPETVHFDAGSNSATVRITFPDITGRVVHKLSLSVPDEYVNTYSKDMKTYDAKVVLSTWIKIVKDAEFYGVSYDDDEINIYEFSDIYWLEQQNKFRISNFLASGVDLTFTLDTSSNYVDFDPADPDKWYGYVVPLDHFSYYKAKTDQWVVADDDGNPLKWTLPYTGYEIDGVRTTKTNYIPVKSSSYGWYMYFISTDAGYEDEHGWFRIANTQNTYVWLYWDPEVLNINGYDE